MMGHLRLPLSWIAHSDRVGIPLMRAFENAAGVSARDAEKIVV